MPVISEGEHSTCLNHLRIFFNYFFLSYGNWSSIESEEVSNVMGELYRTEVFTVCSNVTWKGWLPHSAAKEFKVQARLECCGEGACARGVGWGGKHGYQKGFLPGLMLSFFHRHLSSPLTTSVHLLQWSHCPCVWLSCGADGFRVSSVPRFCKQAMQKPVDGKE